MDSLKNKKLKLRFNNFEKIETNYSQCSQDIFVLMCLNGKENGTFLDLGCNHPIKINNTYLLEKDFNWSGVSIDIDGDMTKLYDGRKTVVYTKDCTNLNFEEIMNNYPDNHIDYLSLDLEPASITLECLKSIPLDKIEFSIITYEHDYYRFGDYYKDESRKLLESFGYKRICSNVKSANSEFEDWYYNPKYISYDNIKILGSKSLNWQEIIFE